METAQKIIPALLLIWAFLLSWSVVNAQDNKEPCSSPEAKQLDFWLGEWKLDWKNEKGETETGSNSISKTLGSCVIEENFSTSDNSFTGRSMSVYNANKKTWQQTWVDNSGAYLDFTGGFNDGKMILSRKAVNKQGKEVIQRMVFYDIGGNEFWWNWESSPDNGENWNVLWKIHYARK